MDLLEVHRSGLKCDVISWNAGISACEKGAQWRCALELFEEVLRHALKPNVVSWSAGICASCLWIDAGFPSRSAVSFLRF